MQSLWWSLYSSLDVEDKDIRKINKIEGKEILWLIWGSRKQIEADNYEVGEGTLYKILSNQTDETQRYIYPGAKNIVMSLEGEQAKFLQPHPIDTAI